MKLSHYCLDVCLGVCSLLFLLGCSQQPDLYQRKWTKKEQKERAESLLNGAGTDLYYQGTVAERAIILEAQKLNPNNGDIYRELGVPYLKRGIATKAHAHYEKAVRLKPKEWQGYWAYCLLYFYRDYANALLHLEKADALTPDFIDYPQSTSVEYMMGLCHLKMGAFNQAIDHLKKHIEFEEKSGNEKYLDLSRIALAQAFRGLNNLEKANEILEKANELSGGNAETWYYYALNLYERNKISKARNAIEKSENLLQKGHRLGRGYVEEFYQIYAEDIEDFKVFLNRPNPSSEQFVPKYINESVNHKVI